MSKHPEMAKVDELYRRYGFQVEVRCRRILGNTADAADAAQEVFVQLLRHGKDFRGQAEWMTWLYRVATNVCLNLLRSRRRRDDAGTRLSAREDEPEKQPGPEAQMLVRETLAALLERCDETTLTIAIHYFLDEMSQDEIGTLIGMSRVSVNKRLMKFREAAQKLHQGQEVA